MCERIHNKLILNNHVRSIIHPQLTANVFVSGDIWSTGNISNLIP